MRKALILIHRYLGIPMSVLFVVWFVSGVVMMYTGGMPQLSAAARLERLPALELDAVRLSPRDAALAAGIGTEPGSALLVTVLGRPAYRFGGGPFAITVFADDGTELPELDAPAARKAAAQFLGVDESLVRYERLVEAPDQWTLLLQRQLPLHKLSVADGARTEAYVAPYTGETVLVTTAAQRALAWLGTIPHWFYFTPLRTNQPLWYWTIVWASVAGAVLAAIGLVLAVTQFRRTRPFRLSASIPYRGPLRWHYITGAIFGAFALTWVVSGLLSLEPFEWTRARGLELPRDTLSGGELDLERYPPLDAAALAAAIDGRAAKEIELRRIQDEPYYLVRHLEPAAADGRREGLHQPYRVARPGAAAPLLIDARTLRVREQPFSPESILARIASAAPDAAITEHAVLDDYDAYYYSRGRQAPLPVLRAKLDDPLETWVYVDLATSTIVAQPHRLNRLERWLFNGLHSLDFAFWYDRRPLWDIGMILLSAGALATSGIGLYLGVKRVKRDLSRLLGIGGRRRVTRRSAVEADG